MADNIQITQGSGTTMRTDDVGGVHHQVVKLDLGGNGVSVPLALGQAAAASSIPVVLATEQGAFIDGLEALITSTNTKLDTVIAKDFATQTTLAAVLAKIIAAPATEAKQDTLIGHVDGIETLIGATNTAIGTTNTNLGTISTTLTTIDGRVDGLEALIGTTNTNLGTIDTSLGTVNTSIGTGNTTLGTISTTLTTMDGRVASTNTKLDTVHADLDRTQYETVAAGQTDQTLGITGATGDILERVLIIPANTSPGAVSIKDGAGSDITIFAGGASSLDVATPFTVELGIKSGSGAWKITTGADVSAIGIGKFAA